MLLALMRELVFLFASLAVIWFVLGMVIRATLGAKAQRFYNAIALLPINVVLTPVMIAIFMTSEVRFYLARNTIYLGFFGVEPVPGDASKQKAVSHELEELRHRWLEDKVNAHRARCVPGLTVRDRNFFAGFAGQSEKDLRFGCKLALVCDYKVPFDLERGMGLSFAMRVLKRVSAAF